MAWLLALLAVSGCNCGDGRDGPKDGGVDARAGDASDRPDAQPAKDAGDLSADAAALMPAEDPSGIKIELDALHYASGDDAAITLSFGDFEIEADEIVVALVSPASGDAEAVSLRRAADGRYRTRTPVPVAAGSKGVPQDGTLTVKPGTALFALYFPDRSQPPLDAIEESIVADLAFLIDPDGFDPNDVVEPAAALTDDEDSTAKAIGTLVVRDELPVQLALEELIVYPADDAELNAILALTDGKVIDRQQSVPQAGEKPRDMVLIEVHPTAADASLFAALMTFTGESADVLVSKPGVLGIVSLALQLRLQGHIAAVNPRLQWGGPAGNGTPEVERASHTTKLVTPPGAGTCVPGDSTRPCVENVPALWAYLALWDRDSARVPVAFLDMGFAPDADFRAPASGTIAECDMSPGVFGGYRCAAHAAEGPPTVGNSFFGGRSWHGTGVVYAAGAVVNNNYGGAGVGGQVLVPMLYKYDTASYAFELGLGMRLAVDQGASCINISGGYPCRILTNVGPDFDICSASGRASLCALVTGAVHAAAALTCATLGAIPFAGPAICGTALAGAAAATTACAAQLALADVAGPMRDGVRYAAERGVPVVTIAGNVIPESALPGPLSGYVNLDEHRTEAWRLMPAMSPEAIVVAAANEDLDNDQFFGDRVDIWAPVPTQYCGPSDVTDASSALDCALSIGATSGAAPYVTGTIAAMMAANPSLNPNTPGLSAETRSGIVARIRELLTAEENSYSNAELVALGYRDQPAERRRLVDPFAAVSAAGADVLPDTASLGYDQTLGFSELLGDDDELSRATAMSADTSYSGTVLALPASGGATQATDVDWYTFDMGASSAQLLETLVTLRAPDGFDELSIAGTSQMRRVSSRLDGIERVDEYRVLASAGATVPFHVRAAPGSDNVYRVSVAAAAPAAPDTIDVAVQGGVLCADAPLHLTAAGRFDLFSDVTTPDADLGWYEGATMLGTGAELTHAFSLGMHTVSVRIHGDVALSESVSFTTTACVDLAPLTTISMPAADSLGQNASYAWQGFDSDRGQWYFDLPVSGSSIDPEDGTLSGTSLRWTTDRTDLQPELLGTGTSTTVRLYGDCTGTTHVITLTGTDSASPTPNATTDTVTIHFWTLC